MEGLVKISPDKEKAKSIVRMVEFSLEMIEVLKEILDIKLK